MTGYPAFAHCSKLVIESNCCCPLFAANAKKSPAMITSATRTPTSVDVDILITPISYQTCVQLLTFRCRVTENELQCWFPRVVQRIGRELPELVMWVRFLPRGHEVS